MKAADGDELQRGQARLDQADRDLSAFRILSVEPAAAATFDKLRHDKKLKKIGRTDLLIACIALAHRATLVTRNRKHFRLIPWSASGELGGLSLRNGRNSKASCRRLVASEATITKE